MELRVLTSVHIGGGSDYEISKYEYLKTPNSDILTIIDMKKLYSKLRQMKLDERFYDFILNARGEKSSLDSFIKENIPVNIRNSLIEDVKKYEIECFGSNFYNISGFIKDKKTNMPYIPGSSIKGMISTAIETSLRKNSPDNFKEILKKIMGCIYVSDSSLIDYSNVLADFIYYLSPDKYNYLNQYYEMLKNDTVVYFTLNVDEEKLNTAGLQSYRINGNTIMEMINDYVKEYEDKYASKYSAKDLIIVESERNNKTCKCYLGGKTGFPTKSYYYQIKNSYEAANEVSRILDDKFKNLRGRHLNRFKVAPNCLKCIYVYEDDCFYENGAVQISIIETINN